MALIFAQTTHDIKVTVQPEYLASQSNPREGIFVWAYHISIENLGGDTVQLLNRHWQITDNCGRVQEVRGPGVVGEQPVLKPGQSFKYTSGTHLFAPSGIMVGDYEMASPLTGARFQVAVPAFSLDSPEQLEKPN